MALSPYIIQYICFWTLGLVNNLNYVIVLSACKSIAENYNKSHLIGVLQWCNVGFGVFMKILNIISITKVTTDKNANQAGYFLRVSIAALFLFSGNLLIAFSNSFYLAAFSILIMSGGSSLGESVLLSYISEFDVGLTGAWSSGTGGAGVAGALLYIFLFSVLELSNTMVFFILLPFTFLYYGCFLFLHYRYGPGSTHAYHNEEITAQETLTTSLLVNNHDSLSPSSEINIYTGSGPSHILSDSDQNSMGAPILSHQLSFGGSNSRLGVGISPLSIPAPTLNNVGGLLGENSKIDVGTPTNRSLRTPSIVMPGFSLDDKEPSMLEDSGIAVDDDSSLLDINSLSNLTNSYHHESLLSNDHEANQLKTSNLSQISRSMSTLSALDDSDLENQGQIVNTDDSANVGRIAVLLSAWKEIWYMGVLLMLVYFFEYVVCVGYASLSNPNSADSKNWFSNHYFEILSFCYQLGVFISRSSISFIKIDYVGSLCIGQGLNHIMWLLHVIFLFMPLGVMFATMFWVGLFAGAMYANVFYILLNGNIKYKQVGVNLVSLLVQVGIMGSSIFTIVFKNLYKQ